MNSITNNNANTYMYKSWKNRNLTSATPFFAVKTEMARGTRTNTGPNDAEDETRIPSENPQLDALLQGLERVTRVAMDYEQRHPREADTFFEYYRSFTSLRPPTFDGTGDFAAAENWVANVKDKLQILRAPEEHRVELAMIWANVNDLGKTGVQSPEVLLSEAELISYYIGCIPHQVLKLGVILRHRVISLFQTSKPLSECFP
jgi:hypothetical protein